ncbi:hypothetical protein CHS0354_023584 [Potamilus streckersoni]|uniref:Cytochrome P450 n=1 Tax=Potamilus streckersoni TaxID=2493646 RepID=A0AAE0VZ33_9BIVA|nr:hypothetical protein CHS0354_023584 [Potamilus streckersoni]
MEYTSKLTDLINLPVMLIILAVVLIYLVFLSGPKNIPPGIPKWNLLASISFFMKLGQRHEGTMQKMRTKYGDIFSVYMGPQLVVIVTGYDNIYQALVKQADVFSDRPTWLPGAKEMTKFGKGIGLNDGETSRVLRLLALQALCDNGVGRTSFEEKIFEEIDAISEALLEKQESREFKHLLTCALNNVINSIVFGVRFEYKDPKIHDLIGTLDKIFSLPSILSPFDFLPKCVIRRIPKVHKMRTDKTEAIAELQAFVYSQIKEHEDTYDTSNIRDFVDLYIKVSKEENGTNDVFTRGNLFQIISELYFGGSETTSASMDWVFLYMIEYPDVQTKCQAEIQKVCGDKPILYADRSKLKYVQATLLEIQRCANVASFPLPHGNKCNATLNGHFIPENTVILPHLESSNLDSKYWDNPKEFQPERFLDESGKLVANPALIPFSVGPRVCPGDALAKMELFLILTNLVQRFTFYREREDMHHGFKRRDGRTLQAAPYKLRAVQRK